MNYVDLDSRTAWAAPVDRNHLMRRFPGLHAIAMAQEAMRTGTYVDVHCWVFTPASFAALCIDMAELDLLDFACHYAFETPRDGLEFYVSMIVCPSKTERVASWHRMLAQFS